MSEVITKNYKGELFDHEVYSSLAKVEKDPMLKKTLIKLSEMERKHAEFWYEIARTRNIKVKNLSILDKIRVNFYLIIRKLLGLNITIKILEGGEEEDIMKYRKLSELEDFSLDERKMLKEIELDEAVHEQVLGNIEAKNIGDFIYGISDGLVEVLAAVSGLSGALTSPLLIAIGGLIVGASGTLSMAIGAYLSTKSERDIKEQERRKLEIEKSIDQRAVQLKLINFFTELGVNIDLAKKVSSGLVDIAEDILYPKVSENPIKSALITGVSYITGAVIPILPYLVGASGLSGLIASYVISGLATFLVGSIIGALSGIKPLRKGVQMTALALLAALATHGLGYMASKLL